MLIISEALHETAKNDIRALIDVLSKEITAIWSPPQCQVILTAEAPRLEFG